MDWSLCFLCQSGRMNGKIRNPQNSNNKQKDSAYVTFEKNLLEFDRIGALPSNITIKNLDEGNGISNTLEKNNAIYHVNCAVNISTSRLSSIVLRTVDTDVVVIAVSQIQVLTITKIITTNLYNLSEKYGSGADLQIV